MFQQIKSTLEKSQNAKIQKMRTSLEQQHQSAISKLDAEIQRLISESKEGFRQDTRDAEIDKLQDKIKNLLKERNELKIEI